MSTVGDQFALTGNQATSGARKEAAIRTYRALAALAVLVAIVYQVSKGLERASFSLTDYFSYFTVLSNLFAVAIFLNGTVRPAATRTQTTELLRGASVMYMLTTGIVYALLLSGNDVTYPWVNTIEHRIMPIAVALDWVIDPPLMRLQLRQTLRWMSFPILYIAYTLIRGAIVNWYPYFFVNHHHHGGYLFVAVGCVAIGAGMIAMIAAITWVGNRRTPDSVDVVSSNAATGAC